MEPPHEVSTRSAEARRVGVHFTPTAADTAGAVREDGSIKLRMVVRLYFPESDSSFSESE